MPRKKNSAKQQSSGGGTAGKKRGGAGAAATGTSGDSEQQSRADKATKRRQLRELHSRVAQLQRRCDELQLLNDRLAELATATDGDTADIVDYLKGRVADKSQACGRLQEELRVTQEAYEAEQRGYAARVEAHKREHQETREQLESDLLFTQGKLTALEEFRSLKEEMAENFADIEQRAQEAATSQQQELYTMDREGVVQKDALGKEMHERVGRIAAEFRQASRQQMADTGQRTVEENAALNRRLADASDAIGRLVDECTAARAKERDNQREIDLLDSVDREMRARVGASLKTLKSLAQTCRRLDGELIQLEETTEAAQAVTAEHRLLSQQASSLASKQLPAARAELAAGRAALARLAARAAAATARRRRHRRLLERSRAAVEAALAAAVSPDAETTEAEAVALRRGMLAELMQLLHGAASAGVGPQPASLGRGLASSAGHRRQQRLLPPRAAASAGSRGRLQRAPSGSGGSSFIAARLEEFGLVSGGGGCRPFSCQRAARARERSLPPLPARDRRQRRPHTVGGAAAAAAVPAGNF